MATIDTVYRARLDYEGDTDTVKDIEDKAFNLASQFDVEAESFTGCPACGPYITGEGAEEAAVAIWADNVEKLIQRHKGATLQS